MSNTNKNQIEFQIGKKQRSIFHYVKVGLLLKGSIDLASMIPGIKKESVFNIVDVAQQKLGLDVLNDYIIKDPELLNFRINRVITDALKKHREN